MFKKKFHQYLWYLILIFGLILQIGLIYYFYWHKHYLVPPGYDSISHYKQIQAILESGKVLYSTYPSGFHYLVIAISKLFHQSIWQVLINWTPVLLILPTLTMFFLLRQIFSLKVSVLSALVLLLTSAYPLFAFVDGNYPDILAYGIFGVLSLAFLLRFYRTNNKYNLLYSTVFLILVALTHHFSFLIIFALLISFALLQLVIYLKKRPMPLKNKLFWSVGAIIFLLALGYLISANLYGGVALDFIGDFLKGKSSISHSVLKIVPDYSDYPIICGPLLWYLGLLGLVYLVLSKFSHSTQNKTKQLVIIWLLLLFILSRFSASGLPARFARELALPLVILIAFLFEFIFEKNNQRHSLGQILSYGLIGYFLVINSAIYTGLDKIPDGFTSRVWFWPIDQEKIDYLHATISPTTPILINPNANLYTPIKSSNMLIPLKLNTDEIAVVREYLANPEHRASQRKYQELVDSIKQKYQNLNYIFDDVKPPGETNEVVYYVYQGYEEKKTVLESLAAQGKILKSFSDGATLYEIKR